MIKINRPAARPAALKTRAISGTLKSLRAKTKRGESITSRDIRPHWSGARDALFIMHKGKCCYCERKRDKAREPDVEHYRPKRGVTNDATHPGYWWLAYEWTNLLWSCKTCNEDKKRNHFPLENELLRVRDEQGDVTTEDPLLLNPALDDGEQFFLYDWEEAQGILVKIHVKDGNARGKATIDVLDLNRIELLQERASYLEFLKTIATGLIVARDQAGLEERKRECISALKSAISPENQFSGLARWYFKTRHLSEYL